jgi:hypothetical protein
MRAEHPTFVLCAVLTKSVFYPSCGFDGRPIKHLGSHFSSFVYVDYLCSVEELDAEVVRNPFTGYEIVHDQPLTDEQINSAALTDPTLPVDDSDQNIPNWRGTWFARWFILRRREGFDVSHGSERFSLLYIRAEGVTAFENLYCRSRIRPAAICVIRPGTGFGRNWTDFTDPNRILARTIRSNPVGQPEFLLWGGWGPTTPGYQHPCWPEYSLGVAQVEPGLTLWRRP